MNRRPGLAERHPSVGEARGVSLFRDTSKMCSCCGQKRDANRVERGLYVCRGCNAVMNADSNGAENIRCRLDQSERVTLSPRSSEDRSSGRVARPVVNLFRRGEHDPSSGQGAFAEHASSCDRKYPNAEREAPPFRARIPESSELKSHVPRKSPICSALGHYGLQPTGSFGAKRPEV